MFPRSVESLPSRVQSSVEIALDPAVASSDAETLVGIDEVQKSLNRSRASVYRYTNTDPRNLNPPFNPRKLNPEYRSDQKDPLLFHPNEVARFAKDVLRIKEVTVEVLNSPSTATQQMLAAILDELKGIRSHLEGLEDAHARVVPAVVNAHAVVDALAAADVPPADDAVSAHLGRLPRLGQRCRWSKNRPQSTAADRLGASSETFN